MVPSLILSLHFGGSYLLKSTCPIPLPLPEFQLLFIFKRQEGDLFTACEMCKHSWPQGRMEGMKEGRASIKSNMTDGVEIELGPHR